MESTNQYEDEDARLAGNLLVGAPAILAYLVYLGMPEDTDVYYLQRAGDWPIGKTAGEGGSLVASKRRLRRTRRRSPNPQKSDAA